jgi:hypothetical protein
VDLVGVSRDGSILKKTNCTDSDTYILRVVNHSSVYNMTVWGTEYADGGTGPMIVEVNGSSDSVVQGCMVKYTDTIG